MLKRPAHRELDIMTLNARRHAAKHAINFVKPNSIVGLGSGATARGFVALLGEQNNLRETIVGVCTSVETQTVAEEVGIRLRGINDVDRIDVTVDGADEVTPRLEMIKGGGGAHFRERVVAELSSYHITIVEHDKVREALGSFPVAVEIVPYAYTISARLVLECLESNNFPVQDWAFRTLSQHELYKTDNANLILDIQFDTITEPARLSSCLYSIRGVVDHGIFLGLTDRIISATHEGEIMEYS